MRLIPKNSSEENTSEAIPRAFPLFSPILLLNGQEVCVFKHDGEWKDARQRGQAQKKRGGQVS